MQQPSGDSQKQHLADGSAVLGRDHHIHHFFQVEAPGQAHSRPSQQVYGKDHGDWGCLDLELVRVGPWRSLSTEELMLLNCGAGEDSESPLDCKEMKQFNPKGIGME